MTVSQLIHQTMQQYRYHRKMGYTPVESVRMWWQSTRLYGAWSVLLGRSVMYRIDGEVECERPTWFAENVISYGPNTEGG